MLIITSIVWTRYISVVVNPIAHFILVWDFKLCKVQDVAAPGAVTTVWTGIYDDGASLAKVPTVCEERQVSSTDVGDI